MRNQGQLLIGALLTLAGLLFLLQETIGIHLDQFCWPMVLILLGLLLILRPRMVKAGTRMTQKLLGDVHRDGPWGVTDEEIWMLFGGVDLDLTQADIPTGETRLRFFGLVGDIKLLVHQDVGVSVAATGILTDAKMLDQKRSSFLTTVELASPNYEMAERKIRLETTALISDLKVKQV